MKNLLLPIIILLVSLQLKAQLKDTTFFGENPGFYGNQWSDQQIIDAAAVAGCNTTRNGISIQQWATSGISVFTPRMDYPYLSKGFRHNVFFLYATPNTPVYTGQSDSVINKHQQIIPKGIYLDPFNADGTINRNNVWAAYTYDWVQQLGAYFDYVEVDNEPDQTTSSHNFQDSTQDALSWEKTEPQAADLSNMYAGIPDYVQLCKITNEVVKKYYPNTKICTGGIGSAWFYSWFLKRGGGKWIDKISIHSYPYFAWWYCAWNGIFCGPSGYQRYSDMLLEQMDSTVKIFKRYQDLNKVPHLGMLCTEFNTPRWTFDTATAQGSIDKRWGNSHVSRNLMEKAIPFLYIQDSLELVISYQVAETADSGVISAGAEIASMGLYKNFMTINPGAQKLTPQGQAVQTLMHYIHNYIKDPVQPVSPAGTHVFRYDSAGSKIYIAWAITHTDQSETASGSYTLPAGQTFKEILFDGSSPGKVSGKITLTGDPIICVQALTSVPTFITSFAGIEEATDNRLQWQIETTDIIDSIIVERSGDGQNFYPIGSTTPFTTNFNDADISGSFYYRIQAAGEGNILAISNIVFLRRDDTQFKIVPNPFKNYFSITVSAPSQIMVYTIDGREITRKNIAAGTSQIAVTGPRGNYIVKVISASGVVSRILTKF